MGVGATRNHAGARGNLRHCRRLGSIEVGKQADIVIWPDDPLELSNYPEQVFVRGDAVSMSSRQTLLRDRYLQSDSELPPAFRQ